MGNRKRRVLLGEFIRNQREITRLSLRQLANLARISNPYLSQIERGLYKPSAQVLKAIADALHISPEALFVRAGLLDEEWDSETAPEVEAAIRLDERLSNDQKEALIRVYRSFVEGSS
jgi:transcriptional regulator with XRE-family HTH domain